MTEYPEAFKWSIEEQVRNRGYLYEEHKIETSDGYILTAFRIPGINKSLLSDTENNSTNNE